MPFPFLKKKREQTIVNPNNALSAFALWLFGAQAIREGFLKRPRDPQCALGNVQVFPPQAQNLIASRAGKRRYGDDGI
jgi:hypothetical protein